VNEVEAHAIITIISSNENDSNMNKYHVTRTRIVNEGIVLEANSAEEAKSKARKTKRKDWSHVESKKRSNYVASKVN